MESECLTSEHTSRIETGPEKWSQIKEGKSGKCGSSISLNSVKENRSKLPVKQTSGKERFSEREKSLKLQWEVHQKLQWEVHQKLQWEFRKTHWGNPSPPLEIRETMRILQTKIIGSRMTNWTHMLLKVTVMTLNRKVLQIQL